MSTLGDYFGSSAARGGPWEQQDGHTGVGNPILRDLGTFFFKVVWVPRAEIPFVFELVCRTLFVPIFELKIRLFWVLKHRFSLGS